MPSYRVVVTDQIFPDVETERALLAGIGAELEVADGSPEEVLATARDADGLLNTYLALDSSRLAQLERCKVVARYGIGVDNIDLDAARDAGIVVTNVPDYCLEEVAVHALGGEMCGRLWARDDEEAARARELGFDLSRPLRTDDLVSSNDTFFATTGITPGDLVEGVVYTPRGAITDSLVMRGQSGTVRWVRARHTFDKLMEYSAIPFK
jgi:hypothetical protein